MLILSRRKLITGSAALAAYAALTNEARAAVALVTHSKTTGAANGGSSSGVNTTGATLLVVCKTYYGGSTEPTLTDSKSNTWTALTARTTTVSSCSHRIYYVANPTVGSGHTITLAGTSSFSIGFLLAFSGVKTVSPFDQESGNGGVSNVSTEQAIPAKTPSQANSLIVSGVSWGSASSSFSIDSGFSITDQQNFVTSTVFGGGGAYLIQGAAASVNPTWTNGGTAAPAATNFAIFKPVVSATGSHFVPTFP